MPAPLLDRMEVIELPGYTSEEKLRIAMLHLIPRVLDQHGITKEHIHIPEVRNPIQSYSINASLCVLFHHRLAWYSDCICASDRFLFCFQGLCGTAST